MLFPSGIATTTVVGTYVLGNGEPARGTISFTPTATIKHLPSNTVITPSPFNVELRGDGSFSIELPVSQSDLVPSSFLYRVEEKISGHILREWNIRLDETMGAQ